MQNVITMFSIPLIHLECNDWALKKQKLIQIPKSLEKVDAVETDYHKSKMKLNYSYNREVENILNEEIEIFLDTINMRYCRVVSSWFENSKKGYYHGVHSHGTKGFSSVCYVNYNEKVHTPLQFIAPFRDFFEADDMFYSPKNVKEGSVLFFPSALLHYTMPNQSDDERLILSFNIDFIIE